jgi:hypothetical protein
MDAGTHKRITKESAVRRNSHVCRGVETKNE